MRGSVFQYKVARQVIFIFCFLLTPCEGEHDKNGWVEGTATMMVESLEDGNYEYTIQYDALQSTAVNSEHKLIKGPISHLDYLLKNQSMGKN